MPERRKKTQSWLTYRDAGVDLDAAEGLAPLLERARRRTFDARVLPIKRAFAGLIRPDYGERLLARNHREPVLAASADGVGSKLLLAAERGRLEVAGHDAVAMNVNDVLACGAEPLFFMDYIACQKMDEKMVAALVGGMSAACSEAHCTFLGGETAEMPDLYRPGQLDVAGFAVGVVEKTRIIDGSKARAGDVIVGLSSSGPHANGFALIRRALERLDANHPMIAPDTEPDSIATAPVRSNKSRPVSGRSGRGRRRADVDVGQKPTVLTFLDCLLQPTRIYVRPVLRLLNAYRRRQPVTALAHVTGGGLGRAMTRILPPRCDADLVRSAWPIPPVFERIASAGIDTEEMYRVFNMGIGFVLLVRPASLGGALDRLRRLGVTAHVIGKLRGGSGKIIWRR